MERAKTTKEQARQFFIRRPEEDRVIIADDLTIFEQRHERYASKHARKKGIGLNHYWRSSFKKNELQPPKKKGDSSKKE